MQKLWKLVFLFWRPIFVWNFFFSIAALSGILTYGAGFSGVGLFIKLLGYSATVYFQHHFSAKNNYYYLNAGYAIRKMYFYTFAADFCLYFLVVVLFLAFHLN